MRRPKIVIIGYPNFTELAREVLQSSHVPSWIDIEVKESPLQLLSDYSRESIRQLQAQYDGDPSTILISGDRSSLILKNELKNLVIPVKVSGFDVLKAIENTNVKEITVLNFGENFTHLNDFPEQLNVTFLQESFRTRKQAKKILEQLRHDGVKEVIGGSWISTIAESYGMKGIFYYSHSSMFNAIQSALHVLNAYRNEMEKATLFKTIVDMNKKGIITTDENLNITLVNFSVEKLLRIKKQNMIGQNIDTIIPNLITEKQLKENQPQHDILFKFNNVSLVADIVPVILEGEIIGLMIALDDVISLQETELQIRKKINKKALKAPYTFKDIIGTSASIRETIKMATKFSQSQSSVLIQAETGTGKELFAQSIHNASNRRNHSFVALNTAALPENLLNSELFGYEEGSFTGAKKGGKPGLFEIAHKGTIFLDEISELPLHLQSTLLRVIQEKEVMRIGGEKVIPVDVRVISASNKNLAEHIKENKFREDLYYRINVLQLNLPPLRERIEDIPILLDHFVSSDLAIRNDILHSDELISLLTSYHWPGNIREFENIMERFKVFCQDEELSQTNIISNMKKALHPTPNHAPPISLKDDNIISLDDVEINLINNALALTNGNKEEAAKRLGISRTTLWRKLKQNE
ncbi:MAG TPA: sigma 54-interacting transcriptional regulator [Candidatus Avamphibacillus sp.]|nr:sigma 54-interacting transcriptional regulator [Candidatus Avamphibacillus sp.]